MRNVAPPGRLRDYCAEKPFVSLQFFSNRPDHTAKVPSETTAGRPPPMPENPAADGYSAVCPVTKEIHDRRLRHSLGERIISQGRLAAPEREQLAANPRFPAAVSQLAL